MNDTKLRKPVYDLNYIREEQIYHLIPHDFIRILDCNDSSIDALVCSLPFSSVDTTAGTETELQAAVMGEKKDIDPPHYQAVKLLRQYYEEDLVW